MNFDGTLYTALMQSGSNPVLQGYSGIIDETYGLTDSLRTITGYEAWCRSCSAPFAVAQERNRTKGTHDCSDCEKKEHSTEHCSRIIPYVVCFLVGPVTVSLSLRRAGVRYPLTTGQPCRLRRWRAGAGGSGTLRAVELGSFSPPTIVLSVSHRSVPWPIFAGLVLLLAGCAPGAQPVLTRSPTTMKSGECMLSGGSASGPQITVD